MKVFIAGRNRGRFQNLWMEASWVDFSTEPEVFRNVFCL